MSSADNTPLGSEPLPTIHQHPLAFLIGLGGVAVLKAFAGEFDRQFTEDRLAGIRALLDAAETLAGGVDVAPLSSQDGYDGWAQTYDEPGNGLFPLEEPLVHELLDSLPVGVAVDAACGTGRHAAYLAAHGHTVLGYDTSPRMLQIAREKVPAASFEEADLRSLPVADAGCDAVICTLALAHVSDLGAAFAEFARVLRPGGHLVISDTRGHFIGSRLYPLIKWGLDGRFGYVPTWHHPTSAYLRAALPHGFRVRACHEPLRGGPIVKPRAVPEPAPPADPQAPPDVWSLHLRAPDAANATYRDHPALIIWHFQLDE